MVDYYNEYEYLCRYDGCVLLKILKMIFWLNAKFKYKIGNITKIYLYLYLNF